MSVPRGSISAKVGEYLAERRKAAGLTQAQLQTLSGVAQDKISRLERGIAQYDIDEFTAIATALGVSLDEAVKAAGAER